LSLAQDFLCVEISTLAYKSNTVLSRKAVSGIMTAYNSDESSAQKSEISTKSMFTVTGRPTDVPLVGLG
jgi:hypothetical protein